MPNAEYLELDLLNMHGGNFAQRFQAELREVYRAVVQHEKRTGTLDGKGKLTIDIELARSTDDMFELNYVFKKKLPAAKSRTTARATDERLLISQDNAPGGGGGDRQMVMLFDRFGRPGGRIDLRTGELNEDDRVEREQEAAGEDD